MRCSWALSGIAGSLPLQGPLVTQALSALRKSLGYEGLDLCSGASSQSPWGMRDTTGEGSWSKAKQPHLLLGHTSILTHKLSQWQQVAWKRTLAFP